MAEELLERAVADAQALGDRAAEGHALRGRGIVLWRAGLPEDARLCFERVLAIDNTAPGVTLDATGFFVDGNTWWTASAAPVLTGAIADAARTRALAGDAAAARALYERLEHEAPELPLSEDQRSQSLELRASAE